MSAPPQKAVGLDIGSNTISCSEITATPSGGFQVTNDTSRAVRLSEGLRAGGPLKKEAILRALIALEKLYEEFSMKSTPVRPVATAVLRMCVNPDAFLAPAREILGTDIEVIDGETEALLTSSGARLGLSPLNAWVVLDIGGQSTELCWGARGTNPDSVSMHLGVVGLTERFCTGGIVAETNINSLRAHVRKTLRSSFDAPPAGTLVTVGGTATNLSVLQLNLAQWDRETVHGHTLTLEMAEEWLRRLSPLSVQHRIDQYRLRPLRADVFPAGIGVLIEVMDFLKVNQMTVSANGLRVGAALSILAP